MESLVDVLIALGRNLALVLALVFVYGRLRPQVLPVRSLAQQVELGLLFGAVTCGAMMMPVVIGPGAILDSRPILIALSVIFGGYVAGAVAVIPAMLLRLWMGGDEVLPGIGTILTGALVGSLIAWRLHRSRGKISHWHLLALGLVAAILCPLWTITLPAGQRWDAFIAHLAPVLLLYPGGSLLLGWPLLLENRYRFTEAARKREARRFQQATTAAGVGIWELDPANHSVHCSANMDELFGLDSGTFPDNLPDFLERVHPEDRDELARHIAHSIENGRFDLTVFRSTWPDGSLHWYEASGTLQQDEEVGALHLAGVVYDVTERQQTQHELQQSQARIRESERLYRGIFDQAAVGVAQIESRTGVFLEINRRYCEILGCSKEEILGRTFQEITHPDDLDQDLRYTAEMLVGHIRSFSMEKRYLRSDGSIVWVNLSVSALWAPGDSPDCHVAVVEDITERKQAETALRESELQLRESQEIARIGSWGWCVSTDVAWVSDTIYTMHGFEIGEYEPSLQYFLQMIHPEDKERTLAHLQDAVTLGKPIHVECRTRTKPGDLVDILILGQPVPGYGDGDGDVYYRGVVQDITALRASERELRAREYRYRKLVESLPVCVHVFDMDGRLISINPSGLVMLSVGSEEEIIGISCLDVVMESDRDRIQKLLEEAMAGHGAEFDYTYDYEGVRRYFRSSFIPLRDDDGNVVQIMGHTVDLTREREREAELQQFVTAIDQAAESIVITDFNARIEYVNPAFEKRTGFRRDDVLGNPVHEYYRHEASQAACEELRKTVAGGSVWKGELVNADRDGQLYREQATISPVIDEHGAVVKVVGVCRDITQERALEAQLLQAQKLEAIGTLAGGIAHDFNNILHSMLGYCRMARDDGPNDPEFLAQCLEEIETGGNRAAELVEQILTFSRASDANFEPLQLPRVLNDVLKFLRGSIPTTIDIQYDEIADPGPVLGDATQIHQLVTNLCTNALHAMEQNGGTLRLTLDRVETKEELPTLTGALRDGAYARLAVEDDGIGISDEFKDRLFDPFFTTKNVGKGTGLGLSIVHGIVTRMNGAIDIKSAPGEGTAITIYLPVQENAHTAPAPVETPAKKSGSGVSVLLVDDEEPITRMLELILGKRGYTVTSFNDPLAALAEIEARSPEESDINIVICDLTMPKMDGLQLAARIQASRPDLPVLLATGILEDDRLAALDTGNVQGVLRKPFNIDALSNAIDRLVPRP